METGISDEQRTLVRQRRDRPRGERPDREPNKRQLPWWLGYAHVEWRRLGGPIVVDLHATKVSSVKSRKLGVAPNVQHAVDIPLAGASREPNLPRKIVSQLLAGMEFCKDTCRRCDCTGHMTGRSPVAGPGHLMQSRSNRP